MERRAGGALSQGWSGRLWRVTAETTAPAVLEVENATRLFDASKGLDGVSLKPLFGDEDRIDREALFLERHYEDQYAAVVSGDWKLIAYWSGKRELYDLAGDPSEQRDVSANYPERVGRLSGLLADWRAEVGLRPEPGAK